ncbi:MAG: TonB family protein [Gammaproteobacteria bacterium]|nr:TonB family protein [Gammaproteobacteria bacterium]
MKPISLFASLIIFFSTANLKAASLLNGLALELEFNKERYIAAVHSETLSANAQELLNNTLSRRLEIRIIAERMSARRLRNQWMEAIAINNPSHILSEQTDNMVIFANLLKGHLLAGDQLNVNFDPSTGDTTILLNDTQLGLIADRAFFNTLLRAWIGNIPPSTEFRDALLASGEIPGTLLQTYQRLKPSAERIAAIAKLNKPQPIIEETIKLEDTSSDEPQSVLVDNPVAEVPEPNNDIDMAPPTLAAIDVEPIAVQTPAVQTPSTISNAPFEPTSTHQPAEAELEPTPEPQINQKPTIDLEDTAEDVLLTAELLFAQQNYHSTLLRHTFKHIRYPRIAQMRNQKGSVRLSVTITTDGQLRSVQTLQESRYSRLNEAALDAVERAEPYPPVPLRLGNNDHTFTVPITFRLSD